MDLNCVVFFNIVSMFISFLFPLVLSWAIIAPEPVASVSINVDSTSGNYKVSNGLINLVFSTSGHLNSLSYGPVSNIFNSLGLGKRAYYDCNFGTDSGRQYERFNFDSFKVKLTFHLYKEKKVKLSTLPNFRLLTKLQIE